MHRFDASQRQVCAALKLSRSVFSYRPIAPDSSKPAARVGEIAQAGRRHGYRPLHLPSREGWRDAHARIPRAHGEQGSPQAGKRPRSEETD
ncbi:hypothetical protein WT60_29815 [Burkholderia sp. MSMB617WGS]|uniref:Transposase n=1 Tax=Burkholderia savannae TaxID=1637837 RepID=A0ABR5T805_9BURK|nr:hypothetical protein [Burkholderia sp. MSMB617WGS]AOJ72547.1 hypothetical protein WS78_28020 [Burkholderia savannae]KGR96516.1 transposase domain protein [Burkholderia sp. ABCPW 111]KVG38549.1 hypothetical protein WS77_20895 [Burkholderia sp. MSMB0265]KVG87194.1 hypothetical protein WS81_28020 [Burkholderia sp. MSMB2040]KVG94716.1 hypothetical protein WS82_06640 [Burkholderia sp. MSMB2041]KVG96543.1 hypothetical protein WS83_02675 [Burkholderia sp. MSMB2042]KVK90132.1 hypothetical protein